MACILAQIILFVLWAVVLISCSKKSQEPKPDEKKVKTTSTSPSIIVSVGSVEKTCSKQTTVSKTVSIQNDREKEKKDSSSSQESKELKEVVKVKSQKKKSQESVVHNEDKEKKTPIKKKSEKRSRESKKIKKLSIETLGDRDEDVKCDNEVSQKVEESERTLHFSKKKVPEKNIEKMELLEPTPLSWNN